MRGPLPLLLLLVGCASLEPLGRSNHDDVSTPTWSVPMGSTMKGLWGLGDSEAVSATLTDLDDTEPASSRAAT